MDQIAFHLTGETPILMRNVRLANPLDRYTKALSKITSKRIKTDEDYAAMARIEWEGSLYLHEGKLALPMRVLRKTVERGAAKKKKGTAWKTGCIIVQDNIPLVYKGTPIIASGVDEIPDPALNKSFPDHNYQVMVGVGQSKVLRTRPIIEDWSLDFSVDFDPGVVDSGMILQMVEDAGKLAGIGDWRVEKGGPFGRFSVEVV